MAARACVAATLLAACWLATATAPADDWPQWRGPQRDGVSRETGLRREWAEGGPPRVWQVENAGVGYSSLSVNEGRVFTQGDLDGVEHVLAYSAVDGSLLWAVQPEPVARALDENVAEQFRRLDANGDGQLDDMEALRGLGSRALAADVAGEGDAAAIAAERAAKFLQAVDENGDGGLTMAEMPQPLWSNFARIDREDREADVDELAASRAKEALGRADDDGDGKISRDEARGNEFRNLFNRVDQREPGENRGDGQLTEGELQSYFATRERGRDGRVTADELQQYFQSQFPGRDGVLTKAELRRHLGGYRNSYGDGPRGTPTVDGDRVYAEGGSGDVTCLDAATGKTIWHLNLADDLGGGRPGWGYSESPLVVGPWLIVTPGGRDGTLAALDKNTGRLVWRSSGVTEGAQYSSPVLARIAGVEQIVQFARNSVFAVTLEDGKFLWQYTAANNGTANVATPLVDGDYVLASSGYGTGAGLVRISGSPQAQRADEVYFEPRLANHHGGLVKVGDHVYGFGNGGLICLNFLTGEIAWTARSVGKGSLTCADGHLYCLSEGGAMALVEVNPREYVEKGRFSLPRSDRASWAHPVVANGRLYVRDQNMLTCFDVRAQ